VDPVVRGLAYLARFQSERGSLHGDYDGPLFLLPGYVFAHHATATPLPEEQREQFVEYIGRMQNADGGFGLHVEGDSYLFTTVLNYVALRLLGQSKRHETSARALAWIQRHGGALGIPSWGKCWLAVLRLYDWDGVNPLPPELWLLPRWFPAHPRRMWCHARVIYLALSHLYGRRWQVPETPLLREVREEIFVPRRYEEIDFPNARNEVASTDVYVPHSFLLRRINDVLVVLEPRIPPRLRARALARTLEHIKSEQRTTDFIDIGPVNKALDVIALHAAEPGSAHTTRSLERLDVYLFEGEAGLTMQAYNSSELWDTAFAAQALAATRHAEEFRPLAEDAWRYLAENQVLEDVPERKRFYRDPSRGGWPFSNRAHGWPIADCTAEGLKAVLALEPLLDRSLPSERLVAAVDLLLHWQNRDGGWPTYERRRASTRLELLNASELFADVMVDHSHVELTSSAIQGLAAARGRLGVDLGRDRLAAITCAVERGARFLRTRQRADGSWEGAWGICFTYGTWFGVWGLLAAGTAPADPAIQRAAGFLLEKQLPDGGWGESYESCLRREYVHHPDGGQVVMTAWALLTLLRSPSLAASGAVACGIRFLLDRQLENGDWPQRSVTGVFNRTCMLNYRFYRNYFPLWALALAERSDYSLEVTLPRAHA
jgi:squalene/oxidosqualene cyclase-like protein